MTRPSNLIYSVTETPPSVVCLLSAFQHIAILAPTLAYPILVMRAAGFSEQAIVPAVSLALVAMGVGTALQTSAHRYVGSGYLITFCNSGAYYPVSVAAAAAGGMPLVAGMTLLAGACETILSQAVKRLRPFFPAEISGICVLLIGVAIGLLGLRLMFGFEEAATPLAGVNTRALTLGCGTLALMIGLNVWSKGALRMYCAIIGIVAGYAAGVLDGQVHAGAFAALAHTGIVAVPDWFSHLPSFRVELVVPFAVVGLAGCLRAMGDISNSQRINDRDWVRPNMTSIRNGVLADGVATMISAAIGGVGGNTYSSSVGMATASGVTSRSIGLWIGTLLIILSVFPAVSVALLSIPSAVLGATLVFNSCFVLTSGLQIITSRLLDARKTFIVGGALILSLSRDIFPTFYASAPEALQPFVGSDLTIGVLAAVALNALFRIGVGSRQSATFSPDTVTPAAVRAFLEQQGARWGARRDVMERAIFGAAQAVESIVEHCHVQGPITVEASFDEFNLDIRIAYRGEPFEVAERRPTDVEIRESADGMRRLAGYLLQRNADRVRASRKGDLAVLEFHFQH